MELKLSKKTLIPILKTLSCIVFVIYIAHFGLPYLKYHLNSREFASVEDIEATGYSIFFHETSTKGELTVRQACCVESCARMNLEYNINVMFSSTINKYFKTFESLKKFENIRFFIVDIEKYVKGTPMEKFDTSILSKSAWPSQVTSDALRYLTLYKYGGVYLDLDVMVVRPLRSLGANWAAKEYKKIGSSALGLGMDKLGRYVAEKAIRDFVANFDVSLYTNNGPLVITRVLNDLCRTANKSRIDNLRNYGTHNLCRGFKIYNVSTFNPLPYVSSLWYFFKSTREKITNNPEAAYGYHMFNYMTKDYKIEMGSFYANLAKKFCPDIYEEFLPEFNYYRD